MDIALQGPASRDILLGLHGTPEDKARIKALPWAGVTRVTLGGYDMIVARTGYTGERIAYELFLDPDKAPALFKDLIEGGATPVGLARVTACKRAAAAFTGTTGRHLKPQPGGRGLWQLCEAVEAIFIGKDGSWRMSASRDAVVTRFTLDSKGCAHHTPAIRWTCAARVGRCDVVQHRHKGYSLGSVHQALPTPRRHAAAVFAGARARSQEALGELSTATRRLCRPP